MALTLVQEVRLNVGLIGNAYDLLSEEEITHYLEKNKNNVVLIHYESRLDFGS